MSQYQLTTRGKAVLFLMAIILVLVLYFSFTQLMGNDASSLDDETQSEIVSTRPSESSQEMTTSSQVQAEETQAPSSTENQEETTSEIKMSTLDHVKLKEAATSFYFKANKHEIEGGLMLDDLNQFLELASLYPDEPISIDGYSIILSDEEATQDEKDRALYYAKARASAVYDYLVSKGLDEKRLNLDYHVVSQNAFPEEEKWRGLRVDLYFTNYEPGIK